MRIRSFAARSIQYALLIFATFFVWGCSGVKKTKSIGSIPEKLENALMWEISGKGIKTPSYLFGTIHLIPEKDFFYPKNTLKYIDASEQMVMEIDLEDPSTMLAMATGMFMKGGVVLDDLISEGDMDLINEKLEGGSFGLTKGMIKRLKPILLSAFLLENGSEEPMASYEMKFLEESKKRDMKVSGLETAMEQINMLDSIPYKDQAKMLVDGLKDDSSTGQDQYAQMIELYKEQNLEKLGEMMNESSAEIGDFEEILLTNRNKRWIPKIKTMIKEKSSFIAVGAGHLCGENGVVKLLMKEGYTLKPMN